MNRNKILLVLLLSMTVLLTTAAGVLWNVRNYVIVGFQFYPKGVQQLDLREREIALQHYEKLLLRMPDCEILWNVPFQDQQISSDAEQIHISSLSQADIPMLQYFSRLKTVKAEHCTDYEALQALCQQRPDLTVEYAVAIGSEKYDPEAEQVTLAQITEEEIDLLAYLPNLKGVLCSGGSAEVIVRLKEYCRDHQLDFQILLGGEVVSADAAVLTISAIGDEQLELLRFLPNLKQLHLRLPLASPQKLLALQQNFPNVTVTWEQEICGQVFDADVEEIDLSGAEITDLEAVDHRMGYFPKAKLVFLGECGLDNERLASHRDQVRDQYKLVWTVSLGEKLKSRTDATTFMPVREYVYYFNDEEAYNLRYCEDMVCIDIGHMSIHNIDFVAHMPNLQYLILAHTQLQYIDPISHCKNLKFLELDWSPVKDLTPLKGCTALEDLNLGKVYADFTPVGEMNWLKNLWMIECSTADRYRMTQALPDTKVMVTGAATVANGWRELDNYYAMRDLLGMRYMSW